jgi:hypothetical protein
MTSFFADLNSYLLAFAKNTRTALVTFDAAMRGVVQRQGARCILT